MNDGRARKLSGCFEDVDRSCDRYHRRMHWLGGSFWIERDAGQVVYDVGVNVAD
jgi:hypothetical protein